MTEDWKNWDEPTKASAVVWRHRDGGLRTYTRAGVLWCAAGSSYGCSWSELLVNIDRCGDGTPPRVVPLAEPEPAAKRVVVWRSGDPLDKLKPYVGKEGIEARAERDGVTVTGPLSGAYSLGHIEVGEVRALSSTRWTVTVTAPKSVAPWWLVDRIKPGHVVSWTHATADDRQAIIWSGTEDLAGWREHWDECADPDSWRVTDVYAPGGPKLIAGAATTKEERA